ncbi:hypothetical protein ACN20G_23480 [Streptomyces sp. BI20]|uniref:hypothetical protein n=1 Tax=Streptomyces sp. BI20 TaxID=3403460 RepID=UPI003C79417E
MDEIQNETVASEAPVNEGQEDITALKAEIDKWRHFSRENEAKYKAASAELDGFRQSQMTDTEKAIEAAKVEARNAALAEVGNKLVSAELRAASSAAGVTLPGAEFLNLSSFVGDDGGPDSARIEAFISSLPKPSVKPEFAQNIGLGRQGGNGVLQFTHEQVKTMSPAQILAADKAGQLDALKSGAL